MQQCGGDGLIWKLGIMAWFKSTWGYYEMEIHHHLTAGEEVWKESETAFQVKC